ncbi:MAG: hypothetical protein ATN35_10115 [Epulopiscium sp. Nele67-Bin004]|nr:MAG: hypothetical protein ATN35_10115 [Epulopiscium sp. Nele67-Bin004]
MKNYLRCNNCGYDLCGPEYLANAINTDSFSSSAMHSDNSVLDLSQKSSDEITCPFCNEKGNWSF